MNYVYIKSEPELWTVGFYDPSGEWQPESDHRSSEKAAERLREWVKHWKYCKGIDDTCVCGLSDAEKAWLKSKGERA